MSNYFFLMLSLIFIFTACKNESGNAGRGSVTQGPASVETVVVVPRKLENVLVTNGSILPNEEINLRSETSGQVIRINFTEGSKVTKGQLLVQIDDSELRPRLQKLTVELKTAEAELSRMQQLLDIKGISRQDFETAELRVAGLESDKNLVQAQISKARITAPFNGTIGLRYVSRGAYVTPGDPIARLVETDPVKIEFSVPETYASQIRKDQNLNFSLAGSDKQNTATIYAFDPMIDPGTRSLKVRARTENKDNVLIPGSFVSLRLSLQDIDDALLVPNNAVVPDIQGQKIYLIKDGKATQRSVRTGLQKGTEIQLVEGVAAGDTVITTGLLSIREGAPVVSRNQQ
jgi:membrane fusion protein, multidrug efflux system